MERSATIDKAQHSARLSLSQLSISSVDERARMIKPEEKSGKRKNCYFSRESGLATKSKLLFVGQLVLVHLLALSTCNGFFVVTYQQDFSRHIMPRSKDSPAIEGTMEDSENTSQSEAAVEFAKLIGLLKVTPRTGWVRRGVPKWESVADHSWRVAILSLLLPSDFDITKCIAMGVLHDVAESLTGDICPEDNVSKEDKGRMEAEAVEKIALLLGQASGQTENDSIQVSAQQQLMSILHEYEKRESKEAIGVKDLDLLEMIIQAGEYEECFSMDLSDFFDGTPVSRFRTPVIQNIAQEVHDQRKARREAKLQDKEKDTNGDYISESDAVFVAEFSKASNMSNEDVEQVVKAMRSWERKDNK